MSKSELSFSDTSSIINNFLQEVPVKKSFEEMVLPEEVKKVIGTFIEEQLRADLLRSYGLANLGLVRLLLQKPSLRG